MALLSGLPIKWKLSFTLILSGLTLVVAYVFIAKRVFESDKIAYVFDSQGSRLELIKQGIESRIEKILLTSRSVIATFDIASGHLSDTGQKIFNDEKSLFGLELWNEKSGQTVLRLEKQDSILPPAKDNHSQNIALNHVTLKALGNGKFLIELRYPQSEGEIFRMRTAIDLADFLPSASMSQSLALIQNGKVLLTSDLRGLATDTFAAIARDIGAASSDQTKVWGDGQRKFLVSQAGVGVGDLQILAATPESEALGALGTLFNRSIVFLIFSTFILIVVSLTLARRLTANLGILTVAAEDIRRGNFKAAPVIQSKDEMGVLSSAFAKMTQEIQRLLIETKEKARMEEELKTASLVQTHLLPPEATASFGEIEISGVVVTSSECGGDWWHYFKRGDDLYFAIADATGHGTPAALITTSARSVFSRLENEDLTLIEMMRAWDFAISSCSKKQIFMTALLFRINVKTGEGAYLNAAHETPLLLSESEGSSFICDMLNGPASLRLGDDFTAPKGETPFSLKSNESIILYTDGILSVTTPDGKTLSERRFCKKIAGKAEFAKSAKGLVQAALDIFNDHRGNIPLPDDVSIVAVRRGGPERMTILESESGDIRVQI